MTYNERRQYRYFRMTQIVSNEVVIANDFFGPTLFVVGCDRIDPRRDDIESYVRRVWYLSTLPFDGIAVRPNGTCIGALGGEVGWNKMGISDATLKAQPATEKRRLDYIEQVKAHAEGRTVAALDHNLRRVWITETEQKQRYAKAEADARIRRAAGL